MPLVTIALAPTFAVARDGQRMAFAHRGSERVLAYLALNGTSERAAVAVALWSGVDRERALASLRQALRAVSLAGGEGWIVADRTTLRLHEGIEIERYGDRLLDGWDESWIEAHRPRREAGPPVEAVLGLLAWYRERSPETAVGVAMETLAVIESMSADRISEAVGPLLVDVARLPEGVGPLAQLVARAHYLVGKMESAYALYDRMTHETQGSLRSETIVNARLSQIVVLREVGASRAAIRLGERVVANYAHTSDFHWNVRYHLGLAQYLGGDRDGLRKARAAVESAAVRGNPLSHFFPLLNVAEGLIDALDPAALGFLRAGARLAPLTQDPLALLTLETMESLWLAGEAPEIALDRLRSIEKRAWEARLAPFAANLVDRAATLAHRVGRLDEGRRLLVRGDRVRRRLALRRAPLELARIASLRSLA